MTYIEFTTEELEQEEWRVIPGYDGKYAASSLGRIRRAVDCNRAKAGHILKPCINRCGYFTLTLLQKTTTVHRAVALAFLGVNEEAQINHKDGNKTNNRIENLEYCSGSENMRHASLSGLMSSGAQHGKLVSAKAPRGERNRKAKLTENQVKEIREKHATGQHSMNALARSYNVSRFNIGEIIYRRTWTHI